MSKKIKKKKNKNRLIILVLAVIAALFATAMFIRDEVITMLSAYSEDSSAPNIEETEIKYTEEKESYDLEYDLQISCIDNYAGVYMEDGTDDIVSGIMMLELVNNSQQDLQLARIYLTYPEFVAEFEVTNLPSGTSAVLLEKNRREWEGGSPDKIEVQNVVFFEEKMSTEADKVEVSGGDGAIDITNISGESISGDIYVYYKNIIDEKFYGGITYRAKVSGLNDGETVRITTEHFSSDQSKIVMVTINE